MIDFQIGEISSILLLIVNEQIFEISSCTIFITVKLDEQKILSKVPSILSTYSTRIKYWVGN